VDCAVALRGGSPAEKAVCLEQDSRGSGLAAERALLELAQLKRSSLRDPQGALAALRAHRARFPEGALRGEVDFALLELLPSAGRVEDALTESAALLEKPWGRARSSELRLTRARLYQDRLGKCAEALAELQPIRAEFGAVGEEATQREAQCLERLGRSREAREAWSRLAARGGRFAAQARERLDSLGASGRPGAP
jgi:hypothetical protein